MHLFYLSYLCLCFLQIPTAFLRSSGVFPAFGEALRDASTEQDVEAGDVVPEEEGPCGTTHVQVAWVVLPAPCGVESAAYW